jgi:gliding motility-associated-like protein
MMRRLTHLLAAGLITSGSFATHIIGGEIFYDHLGGDQYRVTLKIYRDCGPGNTNQTGFDVLAPVAVFSGDGVMVASQSIAFTGSEPVQVQLDDPCLSAPPFVCVEVALYSTTFTLPEHPLGYHITYQRCCRSPTIINIPNPADLGLTCTVTIPPGADRVNSSPRFSALPPIALCLDEPMSFDHSATDADGDSLVYALTTPYNGGSPLMPDPNPPAAPPYELVTWAPTFSQDYPMDSDPPVSIDPETGELLVHPSMLASYTVAVSVKEYRNGQLLSEVRRDFRFDVVACSAEVTAIVQPQDEFCEGLTMAFGNESEGGQYWHWDFGEDQEADTSDVPAPNWTYASPGVYTVTLIANPGYSCADTTEAVFEVYAAPEPLFTVPAVSCGSAPIVLTAEGAYYPSATLEWDLGPSAEPTTATGSPVTATFSPIGAQSVTLTITQNGCVGTFSADLHVYPEPAAFFTAAPESPQLAGTPVALADGSDPNGTDIVGWSWTLDGVPMPWTGTDPDWTDTQPGIHLVALTVTTADGCTNTFQRAYEITAGEIVFPNIFSPNGDGENDRFVIPNVQYSPNLLRVFNRWGMPVYEANNYQNQWVASGLPEGTYYYVLQLPNEGREHAGHVTLVR